MSIDNPWCGIVAVLVVPCPVGSLHCLAQTHVGHASSTLIFCLNSGHRRKTPVAPVQKLVVIIFFGTILHFSEIYDDIHKTRKSSTTATVKTC